MIKIVTTARTALLFFRIEWNGLKAIAESHFKTGGQVPWHAAGLDTPRIGVLMGRDECPPELSIVAIVPGHTTGATSGLDWQMRPHLTTTNRQSNRRSRAA